MTQYFTAPPDKQTVFCEFNKEGKIISQRQYYDPNQMIDAAK